MSDHDVLPEAVRLENALNIWIRDMRDQELAKVRKGGRLSVPALAYEEVIKLREILGRYMRDRRRHIQARWNRRAARRTAKFELRGVTHGRWVSNPIGMSNPLEREPCVCGCTKGDCPVGCCNGRS